MLNLAKVWFPRIGAVWPCVFKNAQKTYKKGGILDNEKVSSISPCAFKHGGGLVACSQSEKEKIVTEYVNPTVETSCSICHNTSDPEKPFDYYAAVSASKHSMNRAAHAGETCQPCHKQAGPLETDVNKNPFWCLTCHEESIMSLSVKYHTPLLAYAVAADCGKCHGAFDNESFGRGVDGNPIEFDPNTVSSADNASGRHPTGHYSATTGGTGKAHNNLVDNATGVKVNNTNFSTANYIAAQLNCLACHNPHSLKAPAREVAIFDNYSDFAAAEDTLAKFNWNREAGCPTCHNDVAKKFINIVYKDNTSVAPLGAGNTGSAGSFKDATGATVNYDFSTYYNKIKPSNWTFLQDYVVGEDGKFVWTNGISYSADHLTWLSEKATKYRGVNAPSGISPFMADTTDYFPNRHIMTKGCGYTKEGCHILNPNPMDDLTVVARLGRTTSSPSAAAYVEVQSNFGCTTCHHTEEETMGFSLKAGSDNHSNSIMMGKHANFGCGFGKSTITGAEIACHASGYTSSVHTIGSATFPETDNYTYYLTGRIGMGYSASGSRVSFQFYAWDNNTDRMDNNSVTDWYQESVALGDFENMSLGSAHKKKGVSCAYTSSNPNGGCHDPHFVNKDAPSSMGLTKGCFDCHAGSKSITGSHKSFVDIKQGRVGYVLGAANAYDMTTAGCVTCHSTSGRAAMVGNLFHTAKEKIYTDNMSAFNFMVVTPLGQSPTTDANCASYFDNNSAAKLKVPYGAVRFTAGGSNACVVGFDVIVP